MKIPQEYMDLFQKKAFAHLATLMPDGSPQVTPIWIDYDGEFILFNSALGRQKDRNIRRDNRVALSIQDPENPYRYLQIRGKVIEIIESGADAHIDKLAQKYLNLNHHPYRKPGDIRLIYKVQIEHIKGIIIR